MFLCVPVCLLCLQVGMYLDLLNCGYLPQCSCVYLCACFVCRWACTWTCWTLGICPHVLVCTCVCCALFAGGHVPGPAEFWVSAPTFWCVPVCAVCLQVSMCWSWACTWTFWTPAAFPPGLRCLPSLSVWCSDCRKMTLTSMTTSSISPPSMCRAAQRCLFVCLCVCVYVCVRVCVCVCVCVCERERDSEYTKWGLEHFT